MNKEKRVLDVNALAIFLVEDHPGNQYVSPVIDEGLRGAFTPLVMDILPVRVYWVMIKKWGCAKKESAEAIKHFVKEYETAILLPQQANDNRKLQTGWRIKA